MHRMIIMIIMVKQILPIMWMWTQTQQPGIHPGPSWFCMKTRIRILIRRVVKLFLPDCTGQEERMMEDKVQWNFRFKARPIIELTTRLLTVIPYRLLNLEVPQERQLISLVHKEEGTKLFFRFLQVDHRLIH